MTGTASVAPHHSGEALQCAAPPVARDAHPPASDQSSQKPLANNGFAPRQPFVGRDSEVRQLRAAFEAASTGDGRLVLLIGDPGIGKTALCD
jgi:hypothetical protein